MRLLNLMQYVLTGGGALAPRMQDSAPRTVHFATLQEAKLAERLIEPSPAPVPTA